MEKARHSVLNTASAVLTAAALLYSACSMFGHCRVGAGAVLWIGRIPEGFASLIVPLAVYAVSAVLAAVSVRARAGVVGMVVLCVSVTGCVFYAALLALLLAMNL
jgi:hypothetical protein